MGARALQGTTHRGLQLAPLLQGPAQLLQRDAPAVFFGGGEMDMLQGCACGRRALAVLWELWAQGGRRQHWVAMALGPAIGSWHAPHEF